MFSALGKRTRRTLLVRSVALAGGVVCGIYQYRRDIANPPIPEPGHSTLSPYVLIDASGITLIAPRAEMGRGPHNAGGPVGRGAGCGMGPD
jgi:isoquinoline 1-oxidoreductase beta subunit